MIKKVNGCFLKKRVRNKYLIKERSFSGAKVSSMVDHVKPAIRDGKQDHIIYKQGQMISVPKQQIAKSIMDLTTPLKNNGKSVMVPGIVFRF